MALPNDLNCLECMFLATTNEIHGIFPADDEMFPLHASPYRMLVYVWLRQTPLMKYVTARII